MENSELYKAPESELVDETNRGNEVNLASRWARLGASIIDGFIFLVIFLPIMYMLGFLDDIAEGAQPDFTHSIVGAVLGIVIFFALNYSLLVNRGQTIGKTALNIKITNLEGGAINLSQNILPRYGVYFGVGYLPVFGQVLSMINVLFIFSKQKRCLHDLAGKTQVVKLES